MTSTDSLLSVQVGIRTLDWNKAMDVVSQIESLGINVERIKIETSKGTIAEVTNRLLDKMQGYNGWSIIIDDDIALTFDAVFAFLEKMHDYDAICVMPLPDEPNLMKYYELMYSYYEKNDIEPMTFSCMFVSPAVVQMVRIQHAEKIVSREEHAYHADLVKQGYKHCTPFNVYVWHLDKTGNIDATHNRWYARGLAAQDLKYKHGALQTFLLSPIEGLVYALGTGSVFGLQHTINLRWNEFVGCTEVDEP